MIVITSALLGAIIGWVTATRRKGTGLDKAQYAAGYGIAFAILGLFLTLLVEHILTS